LTAEKKTIHKKYPDLLWALNGTRELNESKEISTQGREILSGIDNKIKILRGLGCEGFQEKFKTFDQLNSKAYLAELVIAEHFLKRGHKVILLGSEYFLKFSPDMLVRTKQGDLFVEVALMSSSDPGTVLFDNLRKITEKYPYLVNFDFSSDVSVPHHDWKEREKQKNKLERSAKQFAADLEKLHEKGLHHKGKTDSFSYEIVEVLKSGTGYPAILTSSCSTSLDFSNAYLLLRLRKKGEKRPAFPASKRGIPYVIALVCDEPGISSGELGYLLYGSPTHYDCFSLPGIPEEARIKQKEKRWGDTLQKLSSQTSWTEIQKAQAKGWEDLLISTYLLPHEYCYVDKPGLFFTEEIMRQVSGVLFCRCSGSCTIFPNPFSIDEMEFSPFWESI